MTTLTDIVNVTAQTPAGALTTGDFSTPAIFTTDVPADPSFTDIFREYTGEDIVAVGTDFGTSSDTYKACQSLLAQPNKPAKFLIVNRETAAAQTKTITFSADLTANCKINGTVNGTAIDEIAFDTDQQTTAGLLKLALEGIDGVASVTVDSTPYRVLTVVAEAEYNLDISLTVTGIANPPTVAIATTVAGRNIVDDLNDLLLVNNAWYVALTVQKTDGIIDSLSRAIQSLGNKDFVYSNGSSDVAGAVANNIQARISSRNLSTFYLWQGIATEYADFAFVGKMYTYDPYVAQAAHKTLVGVTASPYSGTGALTTTQETNVKNQKGNVYRDVAGASIVFTGIRSDGTFWDQKRDLDYFKNQLQINVFRLFIDNPKITFTDKGLNKVGAEILATALGAVVDPITEIGLFVPGSVTVTIPSRADFTANERASRVATKFRLDATLAGSLIAVSIDIYTSI
jgi:hypothetical protein